jgi:hypothetical protein
MVYPSPAHAKALGAGAEVIGERLSAAVRRSAVAGQPRRLPGGALCSAGDRERGPNPTRARVLSEFQRRRPIELDGWRIEYMHGARGSAFVSQTLLNTQGASFG